MNKATTQTLIELCEFGALAARLVSKGRKAWDEDEFERLAGEAIIHRVGEAVARLDRQDPELLVAHPEVSWRPMKGMRNVVAHKYGAVDHAIIWNALESDLPREVAHIKRILDQHSS